MWLNPKFKVKVLKFVYDELIKYRHDAGDNYRLITEAIAKIVAKPFLWVAIQNIVKTILTPSKIEKRLKPHKRIDIGKML